MSIGTVAATINMDAVVHSAIFLAFAGVGAMLVYQGFVTILQAKNKFQGFLLGFLRVLLVLSRCAGVWRTHFRITRTRVHFQLVQVILVR